MIRIYTKVIRKESKLDLTGFWILRGFYFVFKLSAKNVFNTIFITHLRWRLQLSIKLAFLIPYNIRT